MRLAFAAGLSVFALAAAGFCGVSVAQSAPAAKAAPPQLCTKEALQGLLKLVKLEEKPEGGAEQDTYKNFPHQYASFTENGALLQAYSNMEQRNARDLTILLREASKAPKWSYRLDEKGNVYVYEGAKSIESYSCVVMPKDNNGYRKGDIIMRRMDKRTYDNKEYTYYVTKIFRRIY